MKSKQKCRVCVCTQNRACPGGCYWVEEDLCAACNIIVIKKLVMTYESEDRVITKSETEVIAEELDNLDMAVGYVHGMNHDRNLLDFNSNEPSSFPVDVEIYTIEKAGKEIGTITVYEEVNT